MCPSERDSFERGQDVWPGLTLARQDFERFAARLADPVGAHADVYLACACLLRLPGALELLEAHMMSAVPKAVHRVSNETTFVEDVTSSLRLALIDGETGRAPLLERYAGSGPLKSFVMVLAMRRALDGKRRVREVPTEQALFDGAVTTETDVDPGFKQVFAETVKAKLASLGSRERTILRLHFVDGVSADAIGRMYNVHRATATRWIQAARTTIFEQTRDELQAKLKLSASTFESHARRDIDATLSTFLGQDAQKGRAPI